VENTRKAQGIFRTDATPDPIYTDKLELDLASVEPTLAGPKRPQDRVPLRQSKASFEKSLEGTAQKHIAVKNNGDKFELRMARSSSPQLPAARIHRTRR